MAFCCAVEPSDFNVPVLQSVVDGEPDVVVDDPPPAGADEPPGLLLELHAASAIDPAAKRAAIELARTRRLRPTTSPSL